MLHREACTAKRPSLLRYAVPLSDSNQICYTVCTCVPSAYSTAGIVLRILYSGTFAVFAFGSPRRAPRQLVRTEGMAAPQ